MNFTPLQRKVFMALAAFGLVLPNGIFLYYALAAREVLRDAMRNPIALVFIVEAMFLMLFFAWFIAKANLKSPGPIAFIVMSLLGSLWFSLPAFLYLQSRAPSEVRPRRK